MLTEPLPTVIKIEVHIDSLEKKVKAASKKATDRKKLSRAQKALREAKKEIDYLRVEIRRGDKVHATEMASIFMELKRLSKLVENATWYAATKLIQTYNHLQFAWWDGITDRHRGDKMGIDNSNGPALE